MSMSVVAPAILLLNTGQKKKEQRAGLKKLDGKEDMLFARLGKKSFHIFEQHSSISPATGWKWLPS